MRCHSPSLRRSVARSTASPRWTCARSSSRAPGRKAFCAGADIKELRGRDLAAQKRQAERGQAIFAKLDSLPVASIAVINGYAFGGGLELALASTFRLATSNAKVGLPEIKLGLVPGYGGTQRLPRVIGEARALEMIMTGRTVGAEEALAMGLVNRIVEGDPVEAGIAFAREFSGYSLPVLGFARRSRAARARSADSRGPEGRGRSRNACVPHRGCRGGHGGFFREAEAGVSRSLMSWSFDERF